MQITAPLTWAVVELDLSVPLLDVYKIMITFEEVLLAGEDVGLKDLYLEGCYTVFGKYQPWLFSYD